MLAWLTPRERSGCCRMRFGIGMNTDHDARGSRPAVFGDAQSGSGRSEAKALRKLKHPSEVEEASGVSWISRGVEEGGKRGKSVTFAGLLGTPILLALLIGGFLQVPVCVDCCGGGIVNAFVGMHAQPWQGRSRQRSRFVLENRSWLDPSTDAFLQRLFLVSATPSGFCSR